MRILFCLISLTFYHIALADENDGIDNDRDGVIDEEGEQIIFKIRRKNLNGLTKLHPNKLSFLSHGKIQYKKC